MKNKYIILGFIIPAIIFGVIAFTTYHKPGSEAKEESEHVEKAAKGEKDACCSHHETTGEKKMEMSENSIYLLDSKWKNQDGKDVKLSELNGKPTVMALIFTSCAYACPAIVMDMKKVESKMSENERQNTRFLLVSIDPARDNPQKLTQFAKTYNLDLKRWTLLTGKDDDVSSLAAVLGFKYKKEDDGSFSHSNQIFVLDKEGEVEYEHTGLNQDVSDVVSKLESSN